MRETPRYKNAFLCLFSVLVLNQKGLGEKCSPWKFLEICKLEHCVIRFMVREPEQEEKLQVILHLQGRKNPGLVA